MSAPTPGTPRVLLVDESEPQRALATEALRAAGFQVLAVAQAEAALPLWTAVRPDVALVATHAPRFTALAVARRLQALRRDVPFVYLLDAPDPELRLHALEHGHGVDALAKPYDPRELVARVRALLRFRAGVQRAVLPPEDDESALRDRLTGTWNRRAFLAHVRQEMLRCERHGGSFALLAVRLEGLSAFRRAFGRGMAERLVLFTSAVLLQACREADPVGRVAEERFALLLPVTPAEGLPWIRARLGERFERARFQVDGRIVRTPVTLGAAAFPDVQGTPKQLLASAFASLGRSDASQTPVLS